MNMPAIDAGGGPVYQPQPQPSTYKVGYNETVAEIADKFGITPQALREANPQLFADKARRDEAATTGRADPIFYGDDINVPAAPQSVTQDPMSSPYKATHGAPTSEYSAGNSKGSITWNPGAGSVKLTGKTEFTPAGQDGNKVQFKVKAEAELGMSVANKNGNTEIQVSGAQVTLVNAKASVASGKNALEGEGSVGEGFRARYKVILPGENQNPAMAATINPFDPTTIPKGATVIMDGQNYDQTELAGSFRHIGFETKIKDGEGVSYSVTKVDDTHVQVMSGPNKAFEAFNGAGFRFDKGSVMLGRQDNLGESSVRTATFDLANPDAQAAYSHFSATGEVADQTPGVTEVANIERFDFSSQGRLQAKIKPFGSFELKADIAINSPNTGTFTQTTFADGSVALTSQVKYGDNVPLNLTQRFDAQGNEITSERTYEFTVNTGGNNGANVAKMLNWAASGGTTQDGTVQPNQTVKLTFSEAQMTALNRQADKAGDTLGGMSQPSMLAHDYDGNSISNYQFSVSMARNLNQNDYGFAKGLFEISDAADGDISQRNYQTIDMDVKT
ncbi:MAG: LysM peptidoglycan-binding domain-containing protein, partial [Lysobacter sp.]